MTHRGNMGKESVQFLVSVEDAIVREVISRPDRAYALAPGLLVDRFHAVTRRNRYLVRSVCGHYHLRLPVLPVSHPAGASRGRLPVVQVLGPPAADTYALPALDSIALSCCGQPILRVAPR